MIPLGFCFASFGTNYAQVREAAQLIDAAGFDSIWTWDHYVSWNDPAEAAIEGLTTLAGLAEATTRAKLGVLVANNTNRHPARLAKIAATLQEIAHGRFELGMGAGGYAAEQTPFGISEPPASERVARVEEALQIIRGLWSGEPFSFAGNHYTLDNAICAPAPQPAPRLIVGASGPRMARIAGQYADGLNLQWDKRAKFPELLRALDDGLQRAGRDRDGFDLSLHPGWRDLGDDPYAMLASWSALGFNRAIVWMKAPFPLDEIEQLAKRLTM